MKYIKKDLKPRQTENGLITIAHGEVTGHHHSFDSNCGVAFIDDQRPNNTWLSVETEATDLTHQEHSTITHTKGDYFCGRKVEGSDENEPITVMD